MNAALDPRYEIVHHGIGGIWDPDLCAFRKPATDEEKAWMDRMNRANAASFAETRALLHPAAQEGMNRHQRRSLRKRSGA